jgi:hypothetical protein
MHHCFVRNLFTLHSPNAAAANKFLRLLRLYHKLMTTCSASKLHGVVRVYIKRERVER